MDIWRHLGFLCVIILLFFSCQTNKNKTNNESPKDVKIKRFYSNQVCQGDSCAYVHYLMLSSYDDDSFNDYDFVYLGDKYLDTVSSPLPITAIEFCRPFDFREADGSENDQQTNKNAICLLWYNWQGIQGKVPEISQVSIWLQGQRKNLDYLYLTGRRQRMEHYNGTK